MSNQLLMQQKAGLNILENNKLQLLNDLPQILSLAKKEKKSVVHCHGVFDLLHLGHILYFQEAKTFGDLLVVTLTKDEYVNKGPNRPAFRIDQRTAAIAALECVDYVAINDWETAEETIKLISPDIYCKGPDYKDLLSDTTGKISAEKEAIESVGGEIKFTTGEMHSSSKLLNQFGFIFNQQQSDFINNLRKTTSASMLSKDVENFKDLNVLVVGEVIVDEYVFCEALGKSGKEPVLALRDIYTERYSGGAAAVARHLADFCGSVSLVSMLGEDGGEREFFDDSFSKFNINSHFIHKKNSPTIIKRRFVDKISNHKTLGVYSLNDDPLGNKEEQELKSYLDKNIEHFDLVIIVDYGHGFISKEIAQLIIRKSSFASVNAQINAANLRYHSIAKYQNIDCIVINEAELRHELRERNKDLDILMNDFSDQIGANLLAVTQGSSGVKLNIQDTKEVIHCPAFASTIVDKVGSGDAMLAILSLAMLKNLEPDSALFLSSLAAVQSVETFGNKESISKVKLIKTMEHVLK